MILGFSTKINGKPTFFVEKIHKGITENYMLSPINPNIHYTSDYNFVAKSKLSAKYHTIRTDKRDFWRTGRKIDFFINCRQRNMFRFAPVLPVVSVQKIEIMYFQIDKEFEVFIDDICLNYSEIKALAKNDGFDSVDDFYDYFREIIAESEHVCFTGKIIHWTDLKY